MITAPPLTLPTYNVMIPLYPNFFTTGGLTLMMYKLGVYFGRFCPPHRGHLYQIIVASTRCEKLIVVISDNKKQTE